MFVPFALFQYHFVKKDSRHLSRPYMRCRTNSRAFGCHTYVTRFCTSQLQRQDFYKVSFTKNLFGRETPHGSFAETRVVIRNFHFHGRRLMDSHPIVRDAAQCQCVQRFRLQQVNCKRDGIIIIPSAPFGIRIFQASTYSVRQELYRRMSPDTGLAVARFHRTGSINVFPICLPCAKVALFSVSGSFTGTIFS